jgi:hypothetical protein
MAEAFSPLQIADSSRHFRSSNHRHNQGLDRRTIAVITLAQISTATIRRSYPSDVSDKIPVF